MSKNSHTAAPAQTAPQPAFQQRVQPWLMECFGPEIAADRTERNHRFLEESLELVQALGCTASEARQLVDYVFGRPLGEPAQEVGGVMVTLAALCLASNLDMHGAGEVELARISAPGLVAKIRAKQAAKPKHSPLPEHAQQESNMTAPALAATADALLLEALQSYEKVREDMFAFFLSNGFFNAWGKCYDCTSLNDAHEKASAALAAKGCA